MTILVKGAFDTVEDGIANMIVAANADFEKMYSPDRGQFAVAMNENFKKDWVVKKGKKYIKIFIMKGGSAWAFVVNTDDDKKFKRGDILKCAGWDVPARNKARGNILTGGYEISWTGPLASPHGPAGPLYL